jgi:hypothetical protein
VTAPVILELRNEFAAVDVRVDRRGRTPRLMVRDLRSGAAAFLDPLELESIATAGAEQMDALVDPSRRWRDEDEATP